MLLQRFQEIIPNPHFEFPKGGNDEDPYVFVKWAEDRAGNFCMYYKFPSRDGTKMNQKRVVVKELESLLRGRLDADALWSDRAIFEQTCPITNGAGSCGFIVSVRMFEYLRIAAYQGRQRCILHNPERIQEILK